MLGLMLVTSFGLGLVFVPLSLVVLHNVAEQDAGVAGSLLNTGQQVGGATGLAALGTIAWTTVANTARNTGAAIAAGRQPPGSAAALTTHAEAARFARGFLTSAFIAVFAVLVAVVAIRVRHQDLTGAAEAVPEPSSAAARAAVADKVAAASPVATLVPSERAARAAAAVPCRHC